MHALPVQRRGRYDPDLAQKLSSIPRWFANKMLGVFHTMGPNSVGQTQCLLTGEEIGCALQVGIRRNLSPLAISLSSRIDVRSLMERGRAATGQLMQDRKRPSLFTQMCARCAGCASWQRRISRRI